MSETQTAQEILERHYLEMRCGLLSLAASLDRLARAPGADKIANDERMKLLSDAMAIVASDEDNRAERLQLLLSDEYVAGWNS